MGTATTSDTEPVVTVTFDVDPVNKVSAVLGKRHDDRVGVAASLDCTGPTCDTVPSMVPLTPSTSTEAGWPTLTEGTCELSSVPCTS